MWDFRSILAAGYLSLNPCPVFGEDLLYFFYGRPAYRRAANPVTTSARAPMVFVLRPDAVKSLRRVFPFDSGAFPHRYSLWLAHGMTLDDFALDPDPISALRHVSAFFATNRQYWNCEPASLPAAAGAEMEVETLFRVFQDTRPPEDLDDRRHAVEAQFDWQVPVDDKHILAIVLPAQSLDHKEIKDFRSSAGMGIEFVGYELNRHKSATEYQALLEGYAKDIQEKRGFL